MDKLRWEEGKRVGLMRVNVFWKVERLIRDEGKNYGNLLRGKYSFENELNNERIKYM